MQCKLHTDLQRLEKGVLRNFPNSDQGLQAIRNVYEAYYTMFEQGMVTGVELRTGRLLTTPTLTALSMLCSTQQGTEITC
jgi:hypothetical protein